MRENIPLSIDDQFADQLEACERMLDLGHAANETRAPESSLPAEVQTRLTRGLAAVRRLKRMWRRESLFGVRRLDAALEGGQGAAADIVQIQRGVELAHPKETKKESGVEPPHSKVSIGRFQVMRELGRGGCGVVFLAYDPTLKREVALKVPRAEALVNAELRERFQQEARAAGALDHPNIVPVYEAGAVGPVCYIASAYCPGVTLADWLKRRSEPVPFADAATLVAILAEAVQHAHERGVLHRDLKPSNILLSGVRNQESGVRGQESGTSSPTPDSCLLTPIPKITDFGLAKLMAAGDGAQTYTGAVLGTPSYMAPEQAGGKSKQTGVAADVYSLGAILYELLTGRPPFQGDSPLETLQQVQLMEPVPPSRLRYSLPRDLETICLKCLEKEPARRFASATELGEDLRRFRAGESIRARPAGRLERAWRWCRRNRAVAALTAGVALLLVSGTIVAATLAVWALSEKGRADINAEQAEKNADQERQARALADRRSAEAEKAVEDFLAGMENDPRLREADFFDLRKQLLGSALPFYEDFVRQKPGDAALEAKRGRAFFRLAMVRTQLGEHKQAAADHRQAQAIFRKLADDFPSDPEHRKELAASHTYLAYLLGNGSQAEAEAEFRRAMAVYQSLADDFPAIREYRAQQLRRHWNLVIVLNSQGKRAEAETACHQVLALHESLTREFSQVPADRHELGTIHFNVAYMLEELGKHAEAEPLYREALALIKSLTDECPKVLKYWQDLSGLHANLGLLLLKTGRRAEAKAECRQSLKITTQLAERFRGVPYHSFATGLMLHALADILRDEGELDEARRLYMQAIEHQAAAYRTAPSSPMYARGLRDPYAGLAETSLRQQDHAVAAESARKLAQIRPDMADDAYLAAQALARCVLLAQLDMQLAAEKRQPLAQSYAEQAMSQLQEAVRRGFKNGAQLKGDQNFAPLRSRPDFQTLIAELEQR